jgi:hypothetical protein
MPAGSTYTPIATQTATGSSSVVTFTSIPATYTDLVLIVNGNTSSASNQAAFVNVNNDFGTNYKEQNMTTTGAGNITAGYGSAQAAVYIGPLNGSGSPNNFNYSQVNFGLYAGTTNYKDIFTEAGTSGVQTNFIVCNWSNTAAINRIDVSTGAGNWVANSLFALYGIARA